MKQQKKKEKQKETLVPREIQTQKRTTCTMHIQNSKRSVTNISVLLVAVEESMEAPNTLRRTLVSTPVNTTKPMTNA